MAFLKSEKFNFTEKQIEIWNNFEKLDNLKKFSRLSSVQLGKNSKIFSAIVIFDKIINSSFKFPQSLIF